MRMLTQGAARAEEQVSRPAISRIAAQAAGCSPPKARTPESGGDTFANPSRNQGGQRA